jgi:septal ring-binding cell division protein DamX
MAAPQPSQRLWAGIAATAALIAVIGIAALLARESGKPSPEPTAMAAAGTAPAPDKGTPRQEAAQTADVPAPRGEGTTKDSAATTASAGTATSDRSARPPEAAPAREGNATTAGAPAKANTRGLGKLTATLLLQSQQWLHDVPDSHFFIQLLNTEAGNSAPIESFLEGPARLLDPAQLRVYRSSLSGKDRLGVIYGEFRSRKEATAAIASLPPEIRGMQLHVRQVSRLK